MAVLKVFGYPYIMNMVTQKGWIDMDYLSAPEAAKKWGISERRI